MRLDYKKLKLPKRIRKPWGAEIILLHEKNLELTELTIEPGHGTSYHYHTAKDVVLTAVQGTATLVIKKTRKTIKTGKSLRIRKKIPHQIRNETQKPLVVFELESPADKNDLVRLADPYGRAGKPYLFNGTSNRKQKTKANQSEKQN